VLDNQEQPGRQRDHPGVRERRPLTSKRTPHPGHTSLPAGIGTIAAAAASAATPPVSE
jgi:hypothetical protein